MDLTESIAPKSDQLNAEDLLTGPRTVTITEVRRGSAEQPVEIVLEEFGPGRPFKPSKTVRRILVAAWGKEASAYTGRRMTLYRDPAVKFGGMDVGGIRVSHLSHIDKRLTLALTVTRGKRAPYIVEPLKESASEPMITPAQLKTLRDRFEEVGLSNLAESLAWLSDVLGREVTAPKQLTSAEASRVFEKLDEAGEPEAPEPDPAQMTLEGE